MKRFVVLIALISGTAHALPKSLVIGYDGEGKVDPSTASCTAFVKDITNWTGSSLDEGVVAVCTARKNHADSYQTLQYAYDKFSKSIATDNRLKADDAVKAITHLIKNCIDYRWSLSTGGHNIYIDIIPNQIATDCLKLGTDLLNEQSLLYLVPN